MVVSLIVYVLTTLTSLYWSQEGIVTASRQSKTLADNQNCGNYNLVFRGATPCIFLIWTLVHTSHNVSQKLKKINF